LPEVEGVDDPILLVAVILAETELVETRLKGLLVSVVIGIVHVLLLTIVPFEPSQLVSSVVQLRSDFWI